MAGTISERRVRPTGAVVALDLAVTVLGTGGLWALGSYLGVRGTAVVVTGVVVSLLLLLNVKMRSMGASSAWVVPEVVFLIGTTVQSPGKHLPAHAAVALFAGIVALDIGWIYLAVRVLKLFHQTTRA